MSPEQITAMITVPVPIILAVIALLNDRFKAKDAKREKDRDRGVILQGTTLPAARDDDDESRADEMTKELLATLRGQIKDQAKEIARLRAKLESRP